MGVPVIYTASSISLATLEWLVHIRSNRLLTQNNLIIPVEFDDGWCTEVDAESLPKNWHGPFTIPETRQLGDEWVRRKSSVILRVPSAVVLQECNYVINPAHPDFPKLKILETIPLQIDPRLHRKN